MTPKWVEILGDELLHLWDGTHQGEECVPPKRMWYAPLSPEAELWVWEYSEGGFTAVFRWRPHGVGWWFAESRRSDPHSFGTLEEAQEAALFRFNRHEAKG